MINGRFVVYGTPSYLKEIYGYGYIVKTVLKCTNDQLETEMKSFLSSHLEKLDQIEKNNSEMEFHLKTDSDLKLSALISELMRLVE